MVTIDGRGGNRAAVAQANAAANARALAGWSLRRFGIAGRKLFDEQLGDLGLLDLEIGLALEHLAHLEPVLLLVALRAGRPDGGTARGVEQTELDADRVGDFAHDAAEGVDFAHQVSLGNAADGRIAGHLRDQIDVEREQRGAQPHARGSHGGFAAGMAGADNDYVVLFGVLQTATLSGMIPVPARAGSAAARGESAFRTSTDNNISSSPVPRKVYPVKPGSVPGGNIAGTSTLKPLQITSGWSRPSGLR